METTTADTSISQEQTTSPTNDLKLQSADVISFQPGRKIIEDEFIDMSFLQTLTATPLTDDNGVIKYTDLSAKKSDDPNDLPPEHLSRVRIRFESRTEDGELVEKEKNRKELKAFKLFQDNMIPGLHYAVESMRKGEISWFKLSPEYHYGIYAPSEAIKPNAALYFKVELDGFINEKKSFSKMKYEEMVPELNNIREKGNKFFKQQDYEKAFKEYKRGVDSLINFPKQILASLNEEQLGFIADLKAKFANNAAMSCIKRKDYKEGLKYTEIVLSVDPKNAKALFRKGQCYMETGELETAIKAFEESMEADKSGEEECKTSLRRCQGSKQTRQRDERKLYSEVFKRMAAEEEREEEAKRQKEKLERKKEREQAEKKQEPLEEDPGVRIQDLLQGTILDTQENIKINV